MSYMAGDYYTGDYYAGGLLSGLGSLARGALRVGVGFLRGGPIGALAGAVSHAKAETAAAPGNPSNIPAPAVTPHTGNPAVDTFIRTGGRFSAAGRAKIAAMGGVTGAKNAALQPAPMIHPALLGGGRRHMRWTNPKALARAERRIHSAVKHMTKYIRWVHPGRAGHAAPKFRRGKKR